MFVLNCLKRYYTKLPYFSLLMVLLDVLSAFYSGGEQHLFVRHLFVSVDLVSGFANILFWLILYMPIGLDLVQERSTFGISVFCRIPKIKYMMKKAVAIFLYCGLYFLISGIISCGTSWVFGYSIPEVYQVVQVYLVLTFLSFLLLQLIQFVAWLTSSSYVITIVYASMITASQIPSVQEKYSLLKLVRMPLDNIIVVMILIAFVFFITTLLVMKNKDFIGIKKGTNI